MSRVAPSRAKDALIGVVYLAVIAALITLSIMVYNKDFQSFTTVTVRADMVGTALQDGSDVKVRGVLVGEVSDITTNGEGVTVHLRLDPSKANSLPANVQAQILPKTFFGERFVDLELPSAPSSDHLHSGEVIPQDTSKQSIEVQHLFEDLLPVLQAVQPQKLDATLGELSALLRGRGQTIAQTLATVGNYLRQFSPQVPKLTDDLAAFANVANTYTTAAPDLIHALQAMTTSSQTIVQERTQLADLFDSVTKMSNTIGDFLGTNQSQIIGLSRDSIPSLQILAQYSPEFPCIGKALAALIPTVNKAFGVGTKQVGAHVTLHVTQSRGAYVPGKDTPHFDADAGPRCPTLPATALAGTALSAATGGSTNQLTQPVPGLGSANSPSENEFINELIAPTIGRSPSQLPDWSSLLLGPVLRGATVTVR
jgi:phospholipid/cholesterol/gamma-HCH transport system substrate-binding protein